MYANHIIKMPVNHIIIMPVNHIIIMPANHIIKCLLLAVFCMIGYDYAMADSEDGRNVAGNIYYPDTQAKFYDPIVTPMVKSIKMK